MSDFLELDLNETAYQPPENILEAARRGLRNLNRCANPSALNRLEVLLSEYADVSGEQIIVGPGSDILLREIVLCFVPRRKLVMVSPTFCPAVQVAGRFAGRYVSVHLRPPEFSLARDPLLEQLREPTLVIIDNPNSPTARLLLDREFVEAILDRPDTLLVVDEAYFEFSGLTFASMVATHDNLALARTLDKAFGLAGARIGYLIAGRAFQDAFPGASAFLPQVSLEAATEAVLRPGYMWKNVQSVMQERERLSSELEILGVSVLPSSTNFLLLRSQIPDVGDRLRDRGAPVMDLSNRLGSGFIRVAVGMPEDNDVLIRAYNAVNRQWEGL